MLHCSSQHSGLCTGCVWCGLRPSRSVSVQAVRGGRSADTTPARFLRRQLVAACGSFSTMKVATVTADLSAAAPVRLAARSLRRTPAQSTRAQAGARLQVSAAVTVPPAWPGRAIIPEKSAKRTGPKAISLIGSTGSIGTQTLDIVGEFPNDYKVVALSAGSNVTLLAEQV